MFLKMEWLVVSNPSAAMSQKQHIEKFNTYSPNSVNILGSFYSDTISEARPFASTTPAVTPMAAKSKATPPPAEVHQETEPLFTSTMLQI